jgi:hypothetical protein
VKKLVLTEVKRKDNRQEAQVQLERYLRLLTKKDEANLEKFWGLYKEYLKSKGKNKKKWPATPGFLKKFWGNYLLVCIAEAPYFNETRIENADKKEGIILIEVQKYGDDKADFIRISLVNKLRRNQIKKLLGIDWDSMITPLNLSVKNGGKEDTKTLLRKLNLRLEVEKIEDWVVEAMSTIDNLIIKLFPDFLKERHINVNIRYRWGKISLLCIGVKYSKLWFYLEENEVTKTWQKNRDNNLVKSGFTRRLEIPKEQSYQDNFQLIEKYLNTIKRRKLR